MDDYSSYGYGTSPSPAMGPGMIVILLIVVCLICCCCCSSSAAGGYYWWNREGFENIGGSCSPQLSQRKDNHYY